MQLSDLGLEASSTTNSTTACTYLKAQVRIVQTVRCLTFPSAAAGGPNSGERGEEEPPRVVHWGEGEVSGRAVIQYCLQPHERLLRSAWGQG